MDVVVHSNDGDAVKMSGGFTAYALQPGWLLLYDEDGDIELIPSERIECVVISGIDARQT